ncbi:MAG: glycosyltransferase family 1 protein [Rhodoglobus sp.]|nr:glycosyltransferase family 1 protein [Rhodoglobus sp.]
MVRPILIDGRRAQGRPAGVGQYTRSIASAWPDASDATVLISDRLPAADYGELPYRALRGGPVWNFRAAWLARRLNAFYFSPESYLTSFLLGRRAVITVHDLTSLELTKLQTRANVVFARLLLGATLRRVRAIIVPTTAVRENVIRRFPHVAQKITVVPEGVRDFGPGAVEAEEAIRGLDPYLLYLGTVEPRKNVLTLIEAFVASAPTDWNLVLVGQLGWLSASDAERFHALCENPRVHHLGYVPDSWLGTVLPRAAGFAYVSEAEGFGLPVAEAMAAGVPVIHTDDPALIEVAGGAGLVVHRSNLTAELQAAIRELCGWDSATRARHGAAGRAAASRFDWNTAAAETHRIVTRD